MDLLRPQCAPHSVCRLETSNEGRIAGSETRELSPDERTVLQEVADGHAGCQGKTRIFPQITNWYRKLLRWEEVSLYGRSRLVSVSL